VFKLNALFNAFVQPALTDGRYRLADAQTILAPLVVVLNFTAYLGFIPKGEYLVCFLKAQP
jgi:hypothetical protein